MVEPQEVAVILADKSAIWPATAQPLTLHHLHAVEVLHEVATVAGSEVGSLATTALRLATSAVDPTTMPVTVRLRP